MTLDLSMPILIGPQLASQLPQGSTEPLGEYLLEGLSRQYALHAPTAWAELVPAEPLWASAATAAESGGESSKWAGWSDTGSPVSLRIQSAGNLRDA
jgi:hypothetical protein